MRMISLTGTIRFPSAGLEKVRTALEDHIALTLQDPGCLSFNVTESPEIPGMFHVSERFVDQAAFDHHQHRAGNSPWAVASKDGIRDYTIREE